MKKNDEFLRSFFQDLKKEDMRLNMPAFREVVVKKKSNADARRALAAGVALLLLFGAAWYSNRRPPANLQAPSVEAVQFDRDSSLISWTTPTDQLLKDL